MDRTWPKALEIFRGRRFAQPLGVLWRVENLILMALDKAGRLADEELAQEIADFESGRRKLRLRDELGRSVPLVPIIVAVYRHVLEERKNLSYAICNAT